MGSFHGILKGITVEYSPKYGGNPWGYSLWSICGRLPWIGFALAVGLY